MTVFLVILFILTIVGLAVAVWRTRPDDKKNYRCDPPCLGRGCVSFGSCPGPELERIG